MLKVDMLRGKGGKICDELRMRMVGMRCMQEMMSGESRV